MVVTVRLQLVRLQSAALGCAREFLGDSGIRHRVIHQAAIVDLEEALEGGRRLGIEPRLLQRAAHQDGRAVADHGDDRRHRERRRAISLHQLAGGLAEVARRIDQRAVQIKGYDHETPIIAA